MLFWYTLFFLCFFMWKVVYMKKVIFLFVLLSMFQVCYVQAAKPFIASALFGVGVVSGMVIRTTYENIKDTSLVKRDIAKKPDERPCRGHKTSLSSK